MCKKVSILIPVLNEINFIGQLIQCISEQTYPLELIEVIVIDGGSSDGTVEYIKDNMQRYGFNIIILHNTKKYQSYGLNIGLKVALGDIIIRLDAHSQYEKDYITKIVMYLDDKTIINIGGVAKAKGYDWKSSIIAEALTFPVAIGGAKFRYSDKITEAETVFPGAWRKEDLIKINGWNEEWIINEDTELNMRLKKELKGRIIVDPGIKLYYFPRNSIKKLSEQYLKYGLWRMKTFNMHPEALRYSHLAAMLSIPALLIMCLYSFLSIIVNNFSGVYFMLSMAALYILIISICSFYSGLIKFRNNIVEIGYLILCIITIQASWGIGSFLGIFKYGLPVRAIFYKAKNVIQAIF